MLIVNHHKTNVVDNHHNHNHNTKIKIKINKMDKVQIKLVKLVIVYSINSRK
jgi:hypothetical protein